MRQQRKQHEWLTHGHVCIRDTRSRYRPSRGKGVGAMRTATHVGPVLSRYTLDAQQIHPQTLPMILCHVFHKEQSFDE